MHAPTAVLMPAQIAQLLFTCSADFQQYPEISHEAAVACMFVLLSQALMGIIYGTNRGRVVGQSPSELSYMCAQVKPVR
jgi:hypothetical protein